MASSCSSQTGTSRRSWNGRERDALHSRCRSLPPRRTRRWETSSGYRSRSGSGSSGGRIAGEDQLRRTGQQGDFNRVTRDCSRMRVGVRVRPAFQSEVPFNKRSGGYKYRSCVSVSQRKISVRSYTGAGVGRESAECPRDESSKVARNKHNSSRQDCVELRMPNGRQRSFAFDYAFDATCHQREIYER